MEIEGEDGTKLSLRPGDNSVYGRGSGFSTQDLTVSRRHVSLQFKPSSAAAITGTELSDKVSFKVIGKNPIWTQSSGEKIQTFRRSETGEISEGNRFCVSSRIPVWFNLKKRDGDTAEKASDSESGLISIDYSEIDPVKEFGFLVIGIEFDQYPKSRVREVKQWEWFLEDSTNRNSDDDDDDGDKKGRKGLGGKRRRRKKGNEDDDDDWSVESEEDNALLVKSKRVSTPIYSTRSKKTKKDTNASNSSSRVQTKQRGRVDVDEQDDDDETLGGFIVSDEEDKVEEEEDDDDEEEVDVDEDED